MISFWYGRMEKQNLKGFTEKLNQFLPGNKFMYESSKKGAFLDLNVSLENGCITTDLYTKMVV